MKKVLGRNDIIECPLCGYKACTEQWDKVTYKECTNREMRRLYVPITSIKAFSSKKRSYYKCDECKQWICGESLRVFDNNMNKIDGIGWKQICRVGEQRHE